MSNETLDQLVDRAASETASALREQKLSEGDRNELASAFRGRGGAEAMTALGVDAAINWKDAFCAVWPFIKKWLEKLKDNAPIWIRWLIAAVIKFGDGLCG